MRLANLALVAIALASLCLSCTKADNKVAARIGKNTLTVKAIKDEYLAMSPSSRPDLKTIDEKENFAKDIVAKEIMVLEARSRGLDKLPEVTQARTAAVNRSAWQAFYGENVRSKVNVAEDDLQKIFAKQKYAYHIGWIFLRSKQLAEELADRIHRGESFEELAARYSIDPSRGQNGDLGARVLGTLPPGVEDAIIGMSPGQVSGVIPYDAYQVIVKLYDRQDNDPGPFEQAREGLQAIARAMAENARQRELAARIRKDYGLEFNPGAVDMIVAKTRALYQSPDAPVGRVPEFSDEEQDRELARWKGGQWKVRNYVTSVGSLRDYMRPGYGVDRDGIESLVGDYITGELWRAEITAKGYDTRPDVVKAGDRAAEEVIVTRLHDDIVKDVKLGPGKLESFYEENKSQLVTDPTLRIAVIVTADEAGAKAVHDRLDAGAKFDVLAKEKSIDQATGPNGGEVMRPLSRAETEQFPDLQQVLDGLAVGSYSAPFPVPAGFGVAGYMIVKLLERTESRQLGLEEVEEMLGERVLQLEQDQVFGDWLTGKMTEYDVEIYPDVLSAIDFVGLKNQGV
jgi:parvulin-like peptidyl-prolyl isomerase